MTDTVSYDLGKAHQCLRLTRSIDGERAVDGLAALAEEFEAKGISVLPVIIEAASDEDAVAQASKIVDGSGIQLWDRARRVAVPPPRSGAAPS